MLMTRHFRIEKRLIGPIDDQAAWEHDERVAGMNFHFVLEMFEKNLNYQREQFATHQSDFNPDEFEYRIKSEN